MEKRWKDFPVKTIETKFGSNTEYKITLVEKIQGHYKLS